MVCLGSVHVERDGVPYGSGMNCNGYAVPGYNSYINAPAVLDDMQTEKRLIGDLTHGKQLV